MSPAGPGRALGGRVRHRLGRLRQQLRRISDPPGLILLYHRVASPALDPWDISVRPEHFAQQLAVLRQMTEPVRLSRLQSHRRRGLRSAPPVAVTFDDGYADNLTLALPLLERHQVPATIFVTSGCVDQQAPFWWDELGHLLLTDRVLPRTLTLQAAARVWHWRLEAGPPLIGWRAELTAEAGPRETLYLALYQVLRVLGAADRLTAMAQLRAWAGRPPLTTPPAATDPWDRPLRVAELRALAAHPLIEIGAHTVTHPALGELGPAAQWAEIHQCKLSLETLTGQPIGSFSYPFGSFSGPSAELVTRAGYQRACVSGGHAVHRNSSSVGLPRITVGDWSGEEFAERLESWLNR
jgi:peptidoglycan/xylan/chitin deacetylase (PgdA/CDA1 family)